MAQARSPTVTLRRRVTVIQACSFVQSLDLCTACYREYTAFSRLLKTGMLPTILPLSEWWCGDGKRVTLQLISVKDSPG